MARRGRALRGRAGPLGRRARAGARQAKLAVWVHASKWEVDSSAPRWIGSQMVEKKGPCILLRVHAGAAHPRLLWQPLPSAGTSIEDAPVQSRHKLWRTPWARLARVVSMGACLSIIASKLGSKAYGIVAVTRARRTHRVRASSLGKLPPPARGHGRRPPCRRRARFIPRRRPPARRGGRGAAHSEEHGGRAGWRGVRARPGTVQKAPQCQTHYQCSACTPRPDPAEHSAHGGTRPKPQALCLLPPASSSL